MAGGWISFHFYDYATCAWDWAEINETEWSWSGSGSLIDWAPFSPFFLVTDVAYIGSFSERKLGVGNGAVVDGVYALSSDDGAAVENNNNNSKIMKAINA